MARCAPTEPRKRPFVTWTVLALMGLAVVAPAASADTGDCLMDPLACSVDDAAPDQIEVPDVVPELPDVEVPDVEVPDVEVPDVEVPDVEVPDVEVPGVEVPDVEVPEVPEDPEVPEVPEMPEAEPEVPETPEVDTDEPVVQGPGVGTNGGGKGGSGGGALPAPKEVGLERDALPLYPTSLGSSKATASQPAAGPGSNDKVKAKHELQPLPAQFAAANQGPSVPEAVVEAPGPSVAAPKGDVTPTGFRPPTPADVLRFAVATAERFAFPLGLTLAVLLFLAIERRIDRRDPKLATAPVISEYESFE